MELKKFKADPPKRGRRKRNPDNNREWQDAVLSLLPGEAVTVPIGEYSINHMQSVLSTFGVYHHGINTCKTRQTDDALAVTIYRVK